MKSFVMSWNDWFPPINLYNFPRKERMSMDISQKILSDITVFNKYAKFVPEINRRESWDELVERNMAMHIRKYPHIKEEIKNVEAKHETVDDGNGGINFDKFNSGK